jgi:hypothetical protein
MVHYIHLRKIWKVHSLKIMKTFARPHYFTERERMTGLTPPLIVSVPSLEVERSCTCVLDVSILPLFLRCFSGTLGPSRQCGIFLSSYYHLWVWIMIKKNEDYLTKFTSQFMFSDGIPLVSSVINVIY